jgi:hypothetical protein
MFFEPGHGPVEPMHDLLWRHRLDGVCIEAEDED